MSDAFSPRGGMPRAFRGGLPSGGFDPGNPFSGTRRSVRDVSFKNELPPELKDLLDKLGPNVEVIDMTGQDHMMGRDPLDNLDDMLPKITRQNTKELAAKVLGITLKDVEKIKKSKKKSLLNRIASNTMVTSLYLAIVGTCLAIVGWASNWLLESGVAFWSTIQALI